jgi:CelD/BcsL family acetyltransferase involved in cellulose biosynthesis
LIELRDEWNNLHAESNIEHPFLTFEWISCLCQSFYKNAELFILTAREGGQMVGIAPLMKTKIKHRGVWFKAITFIDSENNTNRAGFILGENKKEVLAAMMKYLRKSDFYDDAYLFRYITKDSEDEKLFSEVLNENQKDHIIIPCLISPFIKTEQGWESYFKERSKKFRDHFKNVNNRFMRETNYEVIKYTNQDIDKAMGELLSVSKMTWQYENGVAIASKEENIDFFSSFAKAAAERGWLNLWVLRKNNKPIAFMYALNYKGNMFAIKIGFDKEYSKDSPGDFLSGVVVKSCFEQGIAEFEWLGGTNPYKLKWTSLCKTHLRYMVFGNTFSGKLLCFVELHIIPMLRKIKAVLQPKSKYESGMNGFIAQMSDKG